MDAGIGKDIMGSYDNGIYQPIFPLSRKMQSRSRKKQFIRVIEETFRKIVKDGIDRKLWKQESIIMSSGSGRRILKLPERD